MNYKIYFLNLILSISKDRRRLNETFTVGPQIRRV